MLNKSVSVYVPSKIGNKEIDNSAHVEKTIKYLSSLFGGTTVYNTTGGYLAENGDIVIEKIAIVKSYTDKETLDKNITKVKKYCQSLKDELQQESIALELTNALLFI